MSDHFKNLLDYFFVSSGIAFMLNVAIPMVIGLLTIAWLIYRLYDLRLSVRIKLKELGE
jgi:hypothetical protein